MPIQTHIFLASKDLQPYEAQLRSLSASAISAAEKIIALGDIDIVLYDNPEGTIKDLAGIGGYCPLANTIFISLDPRREGFRESIENELSYYIVHEIHHAMRFRTPIEKETLFEAMISEGLADHFAMEVMGRKEVQPWARALPQDQKETILKLASDVWHEPTYDHAAWFYGSKSESIPRWAGYTLGYDLVHTYLTSHPDAQASSLISVDAAVFLPRKS